MPEAADWATALVFEAEHALDAWRGALRGLESVDFREVPSDIVGRIFQKLIGPEERHRYGQHFTGDDPVDLINAFCIRSEADTVLDPACGSGSFLVRAYYRKKQLSANSHLELISELFGCEIAMYPAHLATLNLAAREINDEANYPRITRRNFFDVRPETPFAELPEPGGGLASVMLPELDAIVGNPPYVRQELVAKDDKARFTQLATAAWPGLKLSGRADLHCYFWPAATRLLKHGGYFGFLTSSSWLDVEYGFALQGWILRHFRILAIMESAAEPWFEDARVKTCITILQRCDDEAERMANRVRFVRFSRKLAEIIGVAPTPENDDSRQAATESLRDRILNAESDYEDESLRIIVKSQRDLWADGVRAGRILSDAERVAAADGDEEDDGDEDDEADSPEATLNHINGTISNGYRAGKWGRYVRAPDIYFDIMRRFGNRFVPLGEIAEIRFGVKTGCDAFFMPWDITDDVLSRFPTDREFRRNAGGAPRADVESGRLRIVKAGDGTVHPIEAEYLATQLHTLRNVRRTVIRAVNLDRVIILVSDPIDTLKAKSPWISRYLRYGATTTFASRKSAHVPLPERPTCASRDPWYDLVPLLHPGIAFWPMAHHYVHIVPGNPERLVCNHRLFDVGQSNLSDRESRILVAVLNSTVVGLWKNFYGRYTGTEGSLDTEVLDVKLVDVPDPRNVSQVVAKRLLAAFQRICKREVGRLVEEQLMECRTPDRASRLAAGPLVLSRELQQDDRRELDDAVLELIGVAEPNARWH